jgi:hypothetical protein
MPRRWRWGRDGWSRPTGLLVKKHPKNSFFDVFEPNGSFPASSVGFGMSQNHFVTS